jgi:molybdate transport system substrate-binding protein
MIIVKWFCKDKKADIMNMGLKIFMILLLAAIFTAASSAAFAEPLREITVSAAMSLKKGFQEIGKVFEAKHGGVKVQFNFGASGDLIRQIEGGAPVDAFASAALREMDVLEERGMIIHGSRRNFAENAIVLVISSNAKSKIQSFADLTAGEIKKIAVGNFKTVPAGRYAEEIFRYYEMLPSIKDKLIFAENVRQVLDYVARNEVDAGVVYATDAKTREREVTVKAVADEKSHRKAVYPLAIIKNTKNPKLTEDFLSFVLSEEGQKILGKYGFKSVRK